MKILKTLVLGALLVLVCCLIYDRITHPPEDWQTRERCKACDALEDQKLQVRDAEFPATNQRGNSGNAFLSETFHSSSFSSYPSSPASIFSFLFPSLTSRYNYSDTKIAHTDGFTSICAIIKNLYLFKSAD